MEHVKMAHTVPNIRPNTLAMQAYDALRAMILEGGIKPGERLNEVTLAESMGLTRGPVREALRRLSEEHLVTVVPHKGAFIPFIEPREVVELYQYREALEVMVVRLVCLAADDAVLDSLRKLLHETRADLDAIDSQRYPEDHDWHLELARLCGNRVIQNELEKLNRRLRLVRLQSSTIPTRAESAYDEHVRILEAIEHRDVEEAEKATRAHMHSALANAESVSSVDKSA
jgi:DNA-binding GntR family transcriptional regulator